MPITNTPNNAGRLEKEGVSSNNEKYVAVNTIQRTALVERLPVDIYCPSKNIIPYDKDNLYPNKTKAIGQRSGTTVSAVETMSSFLSGNGFLGMDEVINKDGQNLWDILKHITDSYSNFKGFALHFNYNMFGQIYEITPVSFENIRVHKNLDKLVYSRDWNRRWYNKEEIEYQPFNPDNIEKEFDEVGGFRNHKGQILYWIPNKKDIYTVCNWDSVVDDAQLEAEFKLYSLSSVQNNYSLDGIVPYPSNIKNKKEIEDIRDNYKNDVGAKNAGGIRLVSAMPIEEMKGWKWFVPISRNNIDSLHTNQKEDARFNIYAAFRQPPILNGVTKDGMFNQDSFADAFHYYNTQTETERKIIEKELRKVLSVSIWPQLSNIEIQPKIFDSRVKEGDTMTMQTQENTGKQELNDTITNLTGRQLQGVFRITRKFKKDELTRDQASLMLKDGFGFNDDQIDIWLVNDD